MIIRAEKNRNYSVISNVILNDERLSMKARGLAAYLLTKPDNWRINAVHLASQFPDGPSAIRAAMRELEACGYLTRTRTHDERGRITWEIVLHETPQGAQPQQQRRTKKPERENRNMVAESPCSGFPYMDKPHMEKPYMENRTLVSTGAVSTEEVSTEVASTGGRRRRATRAASPPPHPSLAVYREVFHRNPNAAAATTISARIDDVDRYREVLTEWALRGFSPTNVAGQLDVYSNGWRPQNGNGKHAPTPAQPLLNDRSWDTPLSADLPMPTAEELTF